MPRPIITTNAQVRASIELGTKMTTRTTVELEGLALEKRLRQIRSVTYTGAMTKLDAHGAVCDHRTIRNLIDAIENELPELHPHQWPIGIIAKCYLGAPYEVHTLDVKLEIVEHFKKGEALPKGMERARSLAIHPGYEFIEVYPNSICAIAKNGSVSVIREGK
ncbi:hypothetical protein [Brevibacillus centrosporus]|uniref:hypothetical protein n=1 Tax=Brevibacillus centrosporus TaxID=54910 RepID=UPI002E247F58|nr:hypothetical protein [Brevibacillus centrosporus]